MQAHVKSDTFFFVIDLTLLAFDSICQVPTSFGGGAAGRHHDVWMLQFVAETYPLQCDLVSATATLWVYLRRERLLHGSALCACYAAVTGCRFQALAPIVVTRHTFHYT